MKSNAPNGQECDDRRTDLQTTLCNDGRHINVRNPQSGSGDVHTVSIATDGDVRGCTCKGWTFNQTCYHVDHVDESPLLLASARSLSQQVATDGGTDEPLCDDRFRLPEDPKHVTEDEYDDDSGVTDVHGCSTCSGFAHGDNEQCATCRQRNVSPVDETPL